MNLSTEWFTWTLESRIYEISRISEVSVQLYYLQGTCWRGLEDCLQKNIWKSCVLHFVMSKLITGVIIDVVSRGQTNGLGRIKQENKLNLLQKGQLESPLRVLSCTLDSVVLRNASMALVVSFVFFPLLPSFILFFCSSSFCRSSLSLLPAAVGVKAQ